MVEAAILPVISIVFNYWIAQGIWEVDRKTARALVILGVTANLLVLGYFKYFDFFLSMFQQRSPSTQDVPLAR